MSDRTKTLQRQIAALLRTADEVTLLAVLDTLQKARGEEEQWVRLDSLYEYVRTTKITTYDPSNIQGLMQYLVVNRGWLTMRSEGKGPDGRDVWAVTVVSLRRFAGLQLGGQRQKDAATPLPPLPSTQKTLLVGWAASL